MSDCRGKFLIAAVILTLGATDASQLDRACDDESRVNLFLLNRLRQQHVIKDNEINKLVRALSEAETTVGELQTRLNSTRNEASDLLDRINNITTAELTELEGLQICSNVTPRDCCEIKKWYPSAPSGLYAIKDPSSGDNPFSYAKLAVYCDMETDGGGWIVIQRRDASMGLVSFVRGWTDYKNGFGDLDGEFWIGLKQIYELTNQQYVELSFNIWEEDYYGNQQYLYGWQSEYFKILEESSGYSIVTSEIDYEQGLFGPYEGSTYFTTFDRYYGENCGYVRQSGWWYSNNGECNVNANPNGRHSPSGLAGTDGIAERLVWRYNSNDEYKIGMLSEMKIRPKTCNPNYN